MSDDNMAEQEPHSADQQKPSNNNFSSQPLRFAAEGAFSGQNLPSQPQELQDSSSVVTDNILNTVVQPGQPGRQEGGGRGGQESGKIPLGNEKSHFGKKLLIAGGATIASGAAIVGGFLGLDKLQSGGNNNSNTSSGAVVTQVDSTQEATSTPTSIPTPEASPTPEIKKYPREIGSTYTFGNTSFELSKALQETGVDHFGELIKVNEVYLNTEDYPEAEEKLNDGIMYGQYLAWQTDTTGRGGVTFEDFKQKVKSGEDMTYTIFGYKEDSDLDYGEVKVDPSKPVNIILLDGPTPAIGLGINSWGFRVLNGELYVEMYDKKGFEINDNTPNKAYAAQALAFDLEWAMALLSERDAQEKKNLIGGTENYLPKVYSFDLFFIPSKTPTFWDSILRVK